MLHRRTIYHFFSFISPLACLFKVIRTLFSFRQSRIFWCLFRFKASTKSWFNLLSFFDHIWTFFSPCWN